jgi:hypothetical protein
VVSKRSNPSSGSRTPKILHQVTPRFQAMAHSHLGNRSSRAFPLNPIDPRQSSSRKIYSKRPKCLGLENRPIIPGEKAEQVNCMSGSSGCSNCNGRLQGVAFTLLPFSPRMCWPSPLLSLSITNRTHRTPIHPPLIYMFASEEDFRGFAHFLFQR